jgi:hypothetical protein
MKKIIALLAAVGTAGMLSAQVTFGIGARGTFGFGLGATLSGDYLDDDETTSVQPFKSFLAGGALVGRLGFDAVPGLFIQPEIGFTHTQISYKTEADYTTTHSSYKKTTEYEYESSFGFNAIDIPIIVGYDVSLNSGVVISPFAGLNLSIPVGSISESGGGSYTVTETRKYNDGRTTTEKYTHKGSDGDYSIDTKTTLVPGVLFGVGVGYKFDDHNMLMGDLRYLLDFTPVQAEFNFLGASFDWDVATRRGLQIGVNYVYFF